MGWWYRAGGAAVAAMLAAGILGGCGSPRMAATVRPPTPTPTERQLITTLAQRAIGTVAQSVSATYSAADGTVIVTATVAWMTDVSAAQEQVKTICFRAQAALWTSGIALSRVTVIVLGPLIDLYADRSMGPYGTAVLTAANAAKFTWASLSADGAWEAYDNVFLRLAFNDAG
ncbi:MAG TPA: hypothetical protein VGN32_08085 [Ktedonobacterales bacterium]|nr:hypothetical protein [Ktedonobacterales bacterium]